MSKANGARRIGVFGGTFDPIHVGHLIAAQDIAFALGLDQVLFVLAGQPPHKPGQIISSDEDRLQMLARAIRSVPHFTISLIDLERPGPSYTVDTLRRLRRVMPDDQLYFMMGADSLRDLPAWHQPDAISELAELAIACRPGITFDLTTIHRLLPATRGRIHLVPTPLIEISSTSIRDRVAANAPFSHHVPDSVERYIRDRNLYHAR